MPADDEARLTGWFSSLKNELETAYLKHDEPWKQCGFSGPEERWVACRKPIADCINKSGSFFDIGCANGYLLESIIGWTSARGLDIVPYGIDLSEKLVGLARQRLPGYRDNLVVGNGLYWESPVKFDFVRTELVYVPGELRKKYIDRIIDSNLTGGGKLLLAEYRSRSTPADKPWLDITLRDWGMNVDERVSGYYDNRELTRVSVIIK